MSRARNIRLLLAFDGTNYAGWQKQRDQKTVQGMIEAAINTMTSAPITLHGAGRTDAGVHALGMVASFHTRAIIPCTGFRMGLNSMLPVDIRVIEAGEAGDDFHARRSARAKTYYYDICTGPVQMPCQRLYSAHVPGRLDREAMRACARLLVGSHDFSSFEAAGSRDPSRKQGRGPVREIFSVRLINPPVAGRFRFEITGDGFLRHMVRNIVGTLLQVGRGQRSPDEFMSVIAARNRAAAGPTAPARGLFLKEVHY
ncbi:MAG: tRNA pseudouridine(38-40) synthase TruA [Desulfobacterales bacterium]|nr:tRNA pseudouridine(38-40) synthase TruA [Desulfobacterales bacterium]